MTSNLGELVATASLDIPTVYWQYQTVELIYAWSGSLFISDGEIL